ncbi:uncharacterized protein LACBIDRAFT_322402 [Laccaria bicolor S238N-H82]|uniref:Predicted protein n=1 Tax=Laccaria bicolor (strain S238N-H82 / ATCC MYA-4686) TaxID=486041 RepID=B0CW59_LACBS|nr:uncharacterized protein LACBIDRAFT_322402 [Laccaria bicolor S238N-H82]EDR13009.1 predicted protein [Laccaria bicolor S238N-H82]|eukprot:XP_001875507.1 predicted protein [Laccaria bicolor S238N-H82]
MANIHNNMGHLAWVGLALVEEDMVATLNIEDTLIHMTLVGTTDKATKACLVMAFRGWHMGLWKVVMTQTDSQKHALFLAEYVKDLDLAVSGGLYCPPLIPARIRRNPGNSWNSGGIKFGRGPCQIDQTIPRNFEWNSNSAGMIPVITRKECSRNETGMEFLMPKSTNNAISFNHHHHHRRLHTTSPTSTTTHTSHDETMTTATIWEMTP